MSVFEEPEWWSSIDKDAALAELHPSIEEVRHERPGTLEDRLMRFEHESAKARREHGRANPVSIAQHEAEADWLIAWFERRAARRREGTAA